MQEDGPRLRKRVLAWGNSYGIRLTRSELDRLHLSPDQPIEITVRPLRRAIDWDALPRLSLGGDSSRRHDEILDEAAEEGL